ncbi:pantoate--beta-alanine ligase [uncultured Nonlabens sp.]|jgi:pantoate--beta-alanine ligase|uniref:pantoate--beta-alanine ligase n=1 Tax=uncultured Nonlabens sp. TaxID=859306 RepID=UPI0030DA5158|tara:strand:- start:4182 stop:5036 length:855 start_codon:yes stop_codon:yes gene_type:complete
MIFKSHKLLVEHLKKKVKSSETIGFVPTMGALHNGHISLMKEAISQCDQLVVSIFVNPTQFDNKKDLEKYPRTVNNDVALIKKYINADNLTVYAPGVEDVYGKKTVAKTYHYDGLENVMEGANRPGHFDGVGTILEFLFKVINPDQAFFGEKDFQQLQIVKKLVEKQKWNIKIRGCPVEREPHGLAMSSRNERLSPEAREKAQLIYASLQLAKKYFRQHSIKNTQKLVEQLFEKEPDFELEYFTIASEETLKPVTRKYKNHHYRGFIVAHIEGVRLIDNTALYS